METHLGYRYVIRSCVLDYVSSKDTLAVSLDIENVGFAPAYDTHQLYLVLETEDHRYGFDLCRDLNSAMDKTGIHYKVQESVSLDGLEHADYTISLVLKDTNGNKILFGNQQTDGVYVIGELNAK